MRFHKPFQGLTMILFNAKTFVITMTKKLTILHANDIHGRLNFTLDQDFNLQGGISLMSGYIKKVREEEKANFFSICEN